MHKYLVKLGIAYVHVLKFKTAELTRKILGISAVKKIDGIAKSIHVLRVLYAHLTADSS